MSPITTWRGAIPVALVCAACGATAACGSDATAPEELPPPRGVWALSRDFVDTLTFEGRVRTYHVHLPRGYDHRTRRPLLLVLHGSGTTFAQMREWTGFDMAADEEDFVVVYPGAFGSWRASDVEFMRRLIDRLTEQWAVDPARVALAGFSAGGFLGHRVACESGLRVRAVATVGATVRPLDRDACDRPWLLPAHPVSSLIVLGDEDESVPLEGGDDALSFAEAVAMWLNIDRCSSARSETSWPDGGVVPRLEIESWADCALATEVTSVVMVGLGHTWPRHDTNPSSIDATDLVTAFVTAHW